MIRILSWNISKRGTNFSKEVVNAVLGHQPKIAILSEYVLASSTIGRGLNAAGYETIGATHLSSRSTGIAIFGSSQIRTSAHELEGLQSRWITVEVPELRLRIAAVHVPGIGDKKAGISKADAWEAVLDFARRQRNENTVIIGDLNTGLPNVDEAGDTFSCVAKFRRLSNTGFVDAWRKCHGQAREYSWYSNYGNGFRLDHAFVSTPLSKLKFRCDYSHIEREEKISNHSIVILELPI
jgi:exodeoxyribonuclease-3